MKCYICDRMIDNPVFNPDYDDFDPCIPCLVEIEDILDDYKDKPFADDDDLPDDPEVERLLKDPRIHDILSEGWD